MKKPSLRSRMIFMGRLYNGIMRIRIRSGRGAREAKIEQPLLLRLFSEGLLSSPLDRRFESYPLLQIEMEIISSQCSRDRAVHSPTWGRDNRFS